MCRIPRRLALAGGMFALAGSLFAAAGCLGISQNPSRFPFLLPTGDIIRTHAKPPGKGYFRNFDPHAYRVEVRPLQSTMPVGAEQVFIATVYDETGKPRRSRRVEWILEGAGSIIEVDESGYFAGRGYKVDNNYAVSYTDYKEHLITRGNLDPSDDFVVRPGQSWCVVSSAVEGQSALTVLVPAISDWDRHKVVVHTTWLDARCEFPAGAILPAGRDHVLNSRVFRTSDQRPIPGYQVRYRILDGPPVVLTHPDVSSKQGGTQEMTLASNPDGEASIRVMPLSEEAGVTRVAVEMVRPDGNEVVARSEARLEWRAANLVVKVRAPPEVGVGGDVPVTISVVNEGEVDSEAVTVWLSAPPELKLLDSEPAARADAGRPVWRLPALAGGQQHLLQVRFRAASPGKLQLRAFARSDTGRQAHDSAVTEVTVPRLEVSHEVPGDAVVGETVPVRVTVRNAGTGAVTGLRVRVGYDDGLAHAEDHNPVVVPLERLEPGASHRVTVPLMVREEGTWPVRVAAVADGDLSAVARAATVRAGRADLRLSVSGTPRVYLGQAVDWTVRLKNGGKLPLANVTAEAVLPPEVTFRKADPDGRLNGDRVRWTVGGLAPGEERELHLTGEARQLSARAVLSCDALADPLLPRGDGLRVANVDQTQGLQQRASATVEILGVPALQIEVFDMKDPVTVGEKTTYRILVRNGGTLAAEGVSVRAELPPQAKLSRAFSQREPKFEGKTVIFPTEDSLAPGAELRYQIEVESVAAGDARFRAEASSRSLPRPVKAEESTRMLSPAQ